MPTDSGFMEAAKTYLVNLCDVGTILGFPCILPMLEFVNAFMKFAQARDAFVYDYIATIKICQGYVQKCTLIQPLHSDLKIFLNSYMLQTHLVGLLKIG
jgi:hypothetical protein